MKTHRQSLFACLLLAGTLLAPSLSAADAPNQPPPWMIEPADTPAQMRLLWQTEPGVRYDLWTSDDLVSWTRPPGYPAAATALGQEHVFSAGPRKFFRFFPIDEQPPKVTVQFPAEGTVAVGRFADLVIGFEDASDIDPASIRLAVGGLGQFAVGSPGLTFDGTTLVFDSGDAALGAYGETIVATLVAADTEGNTVNFKWDFKLELEPIADPNVLVFGSPTLQRAGQQVRGPTAALASRLATGPIKMNGSAAPWSIARVEPDRIVLSYDSSAPTGFSAGQLLCNLTPASPAEIFNRRLLSTSDNPANNEFTLMTEDVELTELVHQGSVAFNENSVIYETDGTGNFSKAFAITWDHTFARVGHEASVSVEMEDDEGSAHVGFSGGSFLTPTLSLGAEIADGGLKRFSLTASLIFDGMLDADAGIENKISKEAPLWVPAPKYSVYIFHGVIAGVPVWGELAFVIEPKAFFDAEASVGFSGSLSRRATFSSTLEYTEEAGLTCTPSSTVGELVKSFEPEGSAEISAGISIQPSIEYLLYSCAGASLGCDFRLSAGCSLEGGEAEWGAWASGSVVVKPAGPLLEEFEGKQWSEPLFNVKIYPPAEEGSIRFIEEPRDITVSAGESASFAVSVEAEGTPTFEWYHNGGRIPGISGQSYTVASAQNGHEGLYHVVAKLVGGQSATSAPGQLTVGDRVLNIGGSLDFGDVVAGSSKALGVTIANHGDADLSILGLQCPPHFSGGWTGVIPPGSGQSIPVTFSPPADISAFYGGTITVLSDKTAGNRTIPCSGAGVAPSRIIALTGDLAFGEVDTGSSAARTLTVANTGNSPLHVTGVQVPTGFSANPTTTEIAPGDTQSIQVTFSPTAVQAYSGNVTVASDASEGTNSIACSGTGVMPSGGTNLLVNGSFEMGPSSTRTHTTLYTGDTSLPGWTVSQGNINYIYSAWMAADGSRSLDMNGENSNGAIQQTVGTIPNQAYRVVFNIAGNPSPPYLKTIRVSASGQSADFTFDSTGYNNGNMGWQPRVMAFVASSTSTTVTFISVAPTGSAGPALDNVWLGPAN